MSEATALGGDLGGQSSGSDSGQGLDTTNTNSSDLGNAGLSGAAGGADQGTGHEAGEGLPHWLSGIEGLDAEYASDTSLKAIQDLPALVKSYVHAQRKMGADKTVLPNKNSTNEEWLSLYHKLGLPTDFDQYTLEKGEESVMQDEFFNQFKETAYNNNMLPSQAQAMFDFINNQTKGNLERMNEEQQQAAETRLDALKEEWGDAFDQNVFKAKAAVNEFGGEDLKAYLNESGLGNDPNLIKAFAKIGESFLKEDNFADQGKPAYAMSPSEAQAKANGYMGDFDGPYYNSNHPDHNRVVQEVNKLFQIIGGKRA